MCSTLGRVSCRALPSTLPPGLHSGGPSQAASARTIICLASLEQQKEVSADLSGELLYLETLIGCDSK